MDEKDIRERIRRLESREQKIVDMVNTLEKTIDRLGVLVENMNDIGPRVRDLEIDMINQKILGKAVQWLGVAVGGTAIVMALTYLFGQAPV